MKTKIVYCLVSDASDYYYEQLLISLCSLRKHNPEAIVEVVCDEGTYATLKGNRSTINDFNVRVIPILTPQEWGKIERSRYLKTNLRKLTQGDYLFIDTDTVICSSLEFIDNFTSDIAAVYDSHVEHPLPKSTQCKYRTERWIWNEARNLGVGIIGLWHFNSGVMYVKDTTKAHQLYEKWFDHYQEQLKYGVIIDQLPLLLSNWEMNNIIFPLEWKMNCQVSLGGIRHNVHSANIIHYFPKHKITLLSSPWILDPIKESGKINVSIRYNIIDNPYTFFNEDSTIAVGAAASILNTPSLLIAYKYSRKVFNIFALLLDAYVRTKRKVHQMISCK